jgi:hypothetical protein
VSLLFFYYVNNKNVSKCQTKIVNAIQLNVSKKSEVLFFHFEKRRKKICFLTLMSNNLLSSLPLPSKEEDNDKLRAQEFASASLKIE